MKEGELFPFYDNCWMYIASRGLLLLLPDLGIFHRKAHEATIREATVWSTVCAGLALLSRPRFSEYAPEKLPQHLGLVGITGRGALSIAERAGQMCCIHRYLTAQPT